MLGGNWNSETMNGTIRSMLGTMLQHLSALPVHMLRQVEGFGPLSEKICFSSARGTHKFLALSSVAVKRPCGLSQKVAQRHSPVLLSAKQ